MFNSDIEKQNKVKTEIKLALAQKDLTLTKLHELLVSKYGRDKIGSLQNLSTKINKNTLRYEEALQIASALDMSINWSHKYNNNFSGYISPY